jgi:hypothetical protein
MRDGQNPLFKCAEKNISHSQSSKTRHFGDKDVLKIILQGECMPTIRGWPQKSYFLAS